MTTTKLANCPYCESPEVNLWSEGAGTIHYVRCKRCGTHGPQASKDYTAVYSWNLMNRLASAGRDTEAGRPVTGGVDWSAGNDRTVYSSIYSSVPVLPTVTVIDVPKLLDTIRKVHAARADDLCWMDLVRIFAAAGLPAPDCRAGDKFAMLRNCIRFVGTLEAGGPWKSYAEVMDWLKWMHTAQEPFGPIGQQKYREISDYVKQWEDQK